MGKTLRIWALILAASGALSVRAQEPEEVRFEPVKSKWLIQSVLEFPFYSFYLGAPAVKGMAYLPNFAPRLGPRVVYRDLGATLTFSLPIPPVEKERRGDSRTTNFVLNSYWRHIAYDLYYQSYRGFYMSSPWTELSVHKPARYAQLPDTQVLNYGVNGYVLFNSENYSLKAAFDQNEFQRKSGGSWMANPFYNHLEMFLGNGFVPGSDADNTPAFPNVASARFDTLGTAVGYGHTYVDGNYFATAQGALGPGIQYQRIQRADGDRSDVFSLALKLNVNLATGWNYPEYTGGMKVLVDSVWARVQNTQVTSSLVKVQFFFGKRF